MEKAQSAMHDEFDVIQTEFPEELQDRYTCLSCLKGGEHGGTYLCRENDTGDLVIVKISEDAREMEMLENEYHLLSMMEDAPALFPRALDLFALDRCRVFVRTYIPGSTIESLVEARMDRPGVSLDKTLQIGKSVLQSLVLLHDMKPPIVHRDIKPQNIVVGEDGSCHLIDFGISRLLHPGEDVDTMVTGTRLTAPPEQFGYRQTDERSDVYSMGVLLRYLMTGEYREDADEALPKPLRMIVQKATRFDPDLRYQRARDMLTDIERMEKIQKPKKRYWAIALSITLLICLLTSVYFIYMNLAPYRFHEPLVEKAVRLQLEKPEGPVTRRDLREILSLHIFGEQIYETDDQFWFLGEFLFVRDDGIREEGLFEQRGSISSLEDLKHMPGLREVSLYRQEIRDLTPLRSLKITHLGIGYNPVTDLSPLSGHSTISSLNLSCLDLMSLEVLKTLPSLRHLILADVPVTDLKDLSGLPVEELNIFNLNPLEADALADMPNLRELTLNKMNWRILDILSETELQDLTVTHANGVPLRALEAIPSLQRIYYYADDPLLISHEPLSFPNLQILEIKNVRLESLSCLSGLSQLEELYIYGAEVGSFDGLEDLGNLKFIFCTSEQAEELERLYPGHAWLLI